MNNLLNEDSLNKIKLLFKNLGGINVFMNESELIKCYKPRNIEGNKGTFGHAHILAGSVGKTGAAILCTKAALIAGAGLVTTESFSEAHDILQTAVPEAMFIKNSGELMLSNSYSNAINSNCMAIGPGIGANLLTAKIVQQVLEEYENPVVIDADALNIISTNKEWIKRLNKSHVLTPHPKEFDRLFGNSANQIERIKKQLNYSKEYGCTIVLKGMFTSISDSEGNLYLNNSGNSGLATGGTGDTLTGFIVGFLAQQYNLANASRLAVYLHGLSANYYLEEGTEETMIASDVIRLFPKVFKHFLENNLN